MAMWTWRRATSWPPSSGSNASGDVSMASSRDKDCAEPRPSQLPLMVPPTSQSFWRLGKRLPEPQLDFESEEHSWMTRVFSERVRRHVLCRALDDSVPAQLLQKRAHLGALGAAGITRPRSAFASEGVRLSMPEQPFVAAPPVPPEKKSKPSQPPQPKSRPRTSPRWGSLQVYRGPCSSRSPAQ